MSNSDIEIKHVTDGDDAAHHDELKREQAADRAARIAYECTRLVAVDKNFPPWERLRDTDRDGARALAARHLAGGSARELHENDRRGLTATVRGKLDTPALRFTATPWDDLPASYRLRAEVFDAAVRAVGERYGCHVARRSPGA